MVSTSSLTSSLLCFKRRNRSVGEAYMYVQLEGTPVKQKMEQPVTSPPVAVAATRVFKLKNFVEQWDGTSSSLEDLEARMLNYNCNALLFVDHVAAGTLRRWNYQKTRLCRQMLPMLQRHHWKDQGFQTCVTIPLQPTTVNSCLAVLEEVQKDPEIVSLHFTGKLSSSEDLRTIVLALVGLLSLRDRGWQRITLEAPLLETDTETTQCCPILEEASVKFDIPIEVLREGT